MKAIAMSVLVAAGVLCAVQSASAQVLGDSGVKGSQSCHQERAARWERPKGCIFGWHAAMTFSVANVRRDDVLHVRPNPGDLSALIGTLPSGTGGITIERCEFVGTARWCRIEKRLGSGALTGWVNAAFIAPVADR